MTMKKSCSHPMQSWGRLDAFPHELISLDRTSLLTDLSHPKVGLPFGMGRSYGDVCLNPEGVLWRTNALNRFIHWDPHSGILVCEAGVLLQDIQQLFIPRGWMLPVTPGTQMVTVGGAIANDVHGKNHHAQGSFGDHIPFLTLLRTDGEHITCGPTQKTEWFKATVGGFGLTGVIVTAAIQLRKVAGPWLETESLPYHNLDTFFALADESEKKWEYTVSWIDCLAKKEFRGIFMRANHSTLTHAPAKSSQPKTLPFTPPFSLVNAFSLRPFNTFYFHLKKWQAGQAISHYHPFFYPLDNLLEWNRMYGPQGFFQYQSVVPRENGKAATEAMLQEIAKSHQGSFLAVLKTFGEKPARGMMSFAQPGVTLALDFPNRGTKTLALFEKLDTIVAQAGGRIYLAKDARMSADLFKQSYPQLSTFLNYRDPGISSSLSRRLIGN